MRRLARALAAVVLALPLSCLPRPARAASDRVRAQRSYELALEMYLNGDFRRALTEVSNAMSVDSGYMPAYALRARIYQVLGDDSSMLKDADKVVDKLGDSLSTLSENELIAYGSALLLEGRTDKALTAFDSALELDHSSAEASAGRARVFRALGRSDKARQELDALISRAERKTPLYLYSRALCFYDAGEYDAAIRDLTGALRLNRDFYAAYGLVGAALARKGDYPRALEAYNKASTLNPEYGYAYLGRAALRLAQGVDEAAFGDFDEAIRVDAHDYAPYFNRAEAYLRRGNREEALADYRKAIDAASVDPEFAIKIGDRFGEFLLWREAVDAYTRAYVLAGGNADRLSPLVNPSPIRNSPWTRPKKPKRDDFAKEPTIPKPKVVLSPIGIAALIHRARAYEELKDEKRALDDLTEAVQRDPSSGPAWAARGMLCLRMGQDDQALDDLNQAVKLSPDMADVRVARGSFYARTDKPKLALEDFNAAVAAEPGNAEAYNSRGALYANSLNEPDKALADIEKAVSLKPDDPSYQYDLGMMRLRTRDFSEAIASFDKALDLKGPPARIMAARADAYSQLGDHAHALEDIQLALEKDPKYAGAYDTLGLIRLRALDFEQAVRDLNQALQLDKDDVSALIHRGRAYGAMGSLKTARRDFQKATELDPHSKEAWTNLCQAKRMLKDPSSAVHDCDRAIAIDSFYAPAYLQRGLCHLAMRDADKTLDDLGNAAALGVRSAPAYLAQAVAHAATRQYRDAHNDYLQAQLIDPSVHSTDIGFAPPRGTETEDFFNDIADLDDITRRDVNQSYMFLVRGDALHNAEHYDKAIVEYTKAMELDGTNADAYVARGMALMAQDALDAAQQDFMRAIELNPQDSQTHVRLTTLLTLKRSYKAALGEAQKALRLDPKSSQAYLRAGNVYYFLRDYPRALQNYLLAVKNDPSGADAYNGAGLGYFALRKYDEALENFSRAIALNPNDDRYYRNRASTYTNLKSFNNATAEFKSASFLNTDPSLVDEYKKLIDESAARSDSSKS